MEYVSERPLAAKSMAALGPASQDGLRILGLSETAEPATIVEAIDAFVFRWQDGTRPDPKVLSADDAPFAMGSLWGAQLVRRFDWEWAVVTFHDKGDSVAPGVFAPDRSLVVYPMHYLMGALAHPSVDVTIALSFNMLEAGTIGAAKAGISQSHGRCRSNRTAAISRRR
jgi:hypothetical protein